MTLPPPTSRRREGFTLLELLVATAIFSLVLAAINGVLYGALRLRSKTTRMIEESLVLQQAVATIKRDLQGIVVPGGSLSGVLKSEVSTSGMDQQVALEIYTTTGLLNETLPWPSVQKVGYALRPPVIQTTAAGKDLVRLVTRNLLSTTQEEAESQWLMNGVERLDFSFYDGTSWRTSWDSTTETSVLPKAIKLQIVLALDLQDGRPKPPMEIIVPVVVQGRTHQTDQATGGQP